MSLIPHRRNRGRSFLIAALALAGSAAMTTAAFAAETPTAGTAVVDGDASEWDTTPDPPGSPDFFSDMLRAGGNGNHTEVESKLYLRYSCATDTLSALVLAEPGITIAANLPDDSHIKIGGTKYVDGNSGDDGTSPDFAWVGLSGATATGWEGAFTITPGSYTINVHTQVNDGGSQTSAVPGRSIPLVLQCGESPQPEPLVVTKTAQTSYERTYPWIIAKSVTPTGPVTTSADSQVFNYTVTATKGEPADSNNHVDGTITVHNPNAMGVEGVTITDTIDGGPDCLVTDGGDRAIPAYGKVIVTYTCSVKTIGPGVNVATATWAGGASSGEVEFAFRDPNQVVNDSVDVTDTFNNGMPVVLNGATPISATQTFQYPQTVNVPRTGCATFPNTARVVSGQVVLAEASAQVEVCRAVPPVIPPEAQPVTPVTPNQSPSPGPAPQVVVAGGPAPTATLTIAKRGPARAAAGRVMTFTITLRNTHATAAATSVVLSDVLPAGYAFAKRPSGAVLRKGKLVWTLGDLAPGASTTIRVQVRIDRNAGGTRCNTAVASAANATTVQARACTRIVRIAGITRTPIVTG